jgi:hypothetical protein
LNNLDADVVTFENIDRERLIEIMIHKFLPCFNRLANSTTDDKQMIEEIRQDWLAILDNNLAGNSCCFFLSKIKINNKNILELQSYQDFMTKLFEEPYGNHYHQLTVNKSNLFERYKDTVHLMKNTYLKQ